MKKYLVIWVILTSSVLGLKAQDCEAGGGNLRNDFTNNSDCSKNGIDKSIDKSIDQNGNDSGLDSMVNLSDVEAMINGKLCSCVSAYPNPTRGNFKIRVAYYEGEEESSFVLFDLSGNVKLDLTEKLKQARREKLSFVEVDGTSFTSGVYLARLNKGNAAKTTKIFVVR